MLEHLERRQFLSAAFSIIDGTLIVRGTARADQILVTRTGGIAPAVIGAVVPPVRLLVELNGRQRDFDPATIQRIRIEAGAGDDRVLLGRDPFTSPAFAGGSTDLPATLLGGDGDDTLVGGSANDLLSGGNGRDALAGSLGDDTLDGGSGSDQLLGQDGADALRGGRGDDRFTLQGDDTVEGGAGNDLYAKVSPRGRAKVRGVEVALSGPVLPDVHFDGATLVVTGTHRADVFAAYHYFLSTGPTITVNGDSTVNVLGGHIERIRMEGGAGDDTMLIGPEDDSYAITPEISPVSLPLELVGGAGNDSLGGSTNRDTLRGGDGDDLLIGGPAGDSLDGGAGNDTLRGNGGNDFLTGAAGTDQIFGGAGTDAFSIDDTNAELKDRQSDEGFPVPAPLTIAPRLGTLALSSR